MRIIFLFLLLIGFNSLKADDLEKDINDTAKSLSSTVDSNFFTSLLNGGTKDIITDYLKENPFSKMSESQVRATIESILNNQSVGKWLAQNPKFLDFSVKWLHDKEALPSFLSIVNKPDKMKLYGYIALGILILSFILNLLNSKGSFFKRILLKLCMFVGVSLANIIAFLIIFRVELYPTYEVVKTFIF